MVLGSIAAADKTRKMSFADFFEFSGNTRVCLPDSFYTIMIMYIIDINTI